MTNEQLNPEEKELMMHALGIKKINRRSSPYRNRFAATPESEDGRVWEALCLKGYATRRDWKDICTGTLYYVTLNGAKAIGLSEIQFNKSI